MKNKNGIVTSESSKPAVEFVVRDLDDDELTEKKLFLEHCEIQADRSTLAIEEMTAQMDSNIPMRMLDDDIATLEKDLKEKRYKNSKGDYEEATECDLDLMKIQLAILKKSKKLEIPMRELRFKIQDATYKKKRIDSPDNQIKKLKKEIRERKETTLASRVQPRAPVGVN